jgi:hypothetical protein
MQKELDVKTVIHFVALMIGEGLRKYFKGKHP